MVKQEQDLDQNCNENSQNTMTKNNNRDYEDKDKTQIIGKEAIIKDIRKQANIRIAIINADNASNTETRAQIVEKLERYKTDISRIQET